MQISPLTPARAARLLVAAMRLRASGGVGSGNFGHAGRPGEVGGSAVADTNALGQAIEAGGKWNESATGERPYGWSSVSDDYVVPAIQHKVIRDNGTWGSSHGSSQMMTGEAAAQMDIHGYSGRGQINDTGKKYVTNFLTHISEDSIGSEEVLHHSFENVRKTDFKVGDTLRLPLTATSGDVGSYGTRLDAESQSGQPTVFEFEKGTQMVAYSGHDYKAIDLPNVEAAAKEFGYVWSEALVAGGYRVTGVSTHYFGSQHSSLQELHPGAVHQIYGKVVKLKQIETFDMATHQWKHRG